MLGLKQTEVLKVCILNGLHKNMLSIYKCLKEQHLRTCDTMLNLRKTFSVDFVFSQLEP